MSSTMILTICISMVLSNRGLSLDIGSRYERAEHKHITLITNLKSWIQSLPKTDAELKQHKQLANCDAILHHYYSVL